MVGVPEHEPVLTREVIKYLNVKKEGKYIDATLGAGGHSFEIIKLGGKVLGIDWDRESLERLKLKVKSEKSKVGENLFLVHGNFKDVAEIARENGFYPARGVLFDLGLSSMQLAGERGFSFERDQLLDMRMDPDVQGVTAADLLNSLREDQLYELFSQTTEGKFARAVARVVTRARGVKRIETTKQLAQLVEQVYQGRRRKIHPATTIFLALRMAVNSELENLREGLRGAVEILGIGGRLVVISFHSGEDGIVKRFFREQEEVGNLVILTKKPLGSSAAEVEANPRSRSAKLRAAEKVK